MARRLATVVGAVVLAVTMLSGPAHAQVELPDPPQIPVVPVPEQLTPVLGLLSPVGSPTCGLLGLGLALSSLLSGSVPVEPPFDTSELLPYLGPVFLACGYIPIDGAPTICALDEQLKAAVAGQAPLPIPIPGPVGTALDQVESVIEMIEGLTGQEVPVDPIELLSGALDCAKAAAVTAPPIAPPVEPLPVDETALALGGEGATDVAAPAETHPATGWESSVGWLGAAMLGVALGVRRRLGDRIGAPQTHRGATFVSDPDGDRENCVS
jgi:hypothetical protein